MDTLWALKINSGLEKFNYKSLWAFSQSAGITIPVELLSRPHFFFCQIAMEMEKRANFVFNTIEAKFSLETNS